MKWRGVPLADLPDTELLVALRECLKVGAALWAEVARRRLVRAV